MDEEKKFVWLINDSIKRLKRRADSYQAEVKRLQDICNDYASICKSLYASLRQPAPIPGMIRWIDADETPPPQSDEYLVCDCREHDTMELLWYSALEGWSTEGSCFEPGPVNGPATITHYAYLPAQPSDYGDKLCHTVDESRYVHFSRHCLGDDKVKAEG